MDDLIQAASSSESIAAEFAWPKPKPGIIKRTRDQLACDRLIVLQDQTSYTPLHKHNNFYNYGPPPSPS